MQILINIAKIDWYCKNGLKNREKSKWTMGSKHRIFFYFLFSFFFFFLGGGGFDKFELILIGIANCKYWLALRKFLGIANIDWQCKTWLTMQILIYIAKSDWQCKYWLAVDLRHAHFFLQSSVTCLPLTDFVAS